MSIIQLDHVSVTFKRKKAADVQAVQDVTLHIEKGDIYGIVGFSRGREINPGQNHQPFAKANGRRRRGWGC